MFKKRILLLFLAVILSELSYGQNFEENFSLALPDSLSYDNLELADVDNDSLHDVTLFARTSSGERVIYFLRNNATNGFDYAGHIMTNMNEATRHLTDFDGDNQIDVILSGETDGSPQTSVFMNRGSFSFQANPIVGLKAALIRQADLDGNGVRELVLSGVTGGVPFVRILGNGASVWEVVHDSIAVNASGFESFDIDADNDRDFILSGVDQSGSPYARAFFNQGGFYFTPDGIGSSVAGITTLADINHDGLFDVRMSGKDAVGRSILKTVLNSGSGLRTEDSVTSVHASQIVNADFDSDGRVDLLFFGFADGDTLNIITGNNIADTLEHRYVRQQSAGDFDRDGDLDVVQLKNKGSFFTLTLLENKALARNQVPTSPKNAIATRIFNRIFLRWNSSSDDHTPVSSLTYDLSIQAAQENLVAGEFDLINGTRLLVSHGNNATQPYALIRDAETGPFFFLIQSVDNSFHAGKGSVCSGTGGISCLDMTTVEMDACKNEMVSLSADSNAEWFSFSDGFLATTSLLSFSAQVADTVFSVETNATACPKIRVYVVQMSPTVEKTTESSRYVCEGKTIRLGVESHWTKIEWSSSVKGMLSGTDSIEYVVSGPDTLKVVVSDGAGCEIQRNTILNVSKPLIEVTPEAVQILKGQSVRLNVTGGSNYEWTPAAELNDPTSPHPLASPTQTTQYVVVVKDSLGCEETGGVTVIVEETAYIPNLFTPNEDGSNDVLKIYGLGSAKEFSFTIFNREGNQVYHTKNISEAVNAGWNGRLRGADLPAGIYYWSVSGQTDSGSALQLNGKNSGSIVLLR